MYQNVRWIISVKLNLMSPDVHPNPCLSAWNCENLYVLCDPYQSPPRVSFEENWVPNIQATMPALDLKK